jgi:CRISPR-associated protein Csx10
MQLGGSPWQDTNRHALESPGTIFTINLLSDAILFEQGWLPTNELSAEMLKDLTGIDARLVRSFTTTTTVGGWNVSWQRPKPTAVATTMGSVFVFQVTGKLTDAHYMALARLEQDGIGERRAEGYGQIRICDEFHLLPPEEAS